MSNRFPAFVIRWRIPIIIGFVAVSALFASRIPTARVQSEMKAMLPADMATRLALDRIEESFGGTEMVMLVVEAEDILERTVLERVEKLTARLKQVAEIDRVLSLFTLKDIRGKQGGMSVEPAIDRLPANAVEREALARRLAANELVFGSVLAKDYSATALVALLNKSAVDSEVVTELRKVVEEVPGPGRIHIAGMPVTRVTVAEGIQGDLKRFLPMGILITVLFLFVCFRQLRCVILPFAVVILAIMFSMGLVPVLGWDIQIITVLLPVILLAVANDYGIHMMARYQEINVPGVTLSREEMAADLMRTLSVPVILAGVTTAIGLLCLLTHIAVPAQQLGILAGAGVIYALLASLMFVPAVMSYLPRARPLKGAGEAGKGYILERLLHRIALVASARPRTVVVATLALTLAVATGIPRVNVDTNPVHYYSPDHMLVSSSKLVDEHFGGSVTVSLMAEGDIKEPAVLRAIDRMESRLRSHPNVGETSSIARVVKKMNRALNGDQPEFDAVPDNRKYIAEMFLLYEMSGDPEDFERLVDLPYEKALVTARVNSASTRAIASVVEQARSEMAADPGGPFKVVAGFGPILAELAEAIVTGQLWSLLLSIVVVCLVVGLAFRSLVAGLVSGAPLAIALLLLFGIMGWARFDLNIATVMLSSIMIGVGVDYTIHFLWRYRRERAAGLGPEAAVHACLTTTGRGIVFNALSVIVGFAILVVSNFIPVQFFGLLVMVSIGACLAGALSLLPALVLLLRPRFLEPGGRTQQ